MQASREAAASLAQAQATHATERKAASHDQHLIDALRRIRSENHVKDIVTGAFTGERKKGARRDSGTTAH